MAQDGQTIRLLTSPAGNTASSMEDVVSRPGPGASFGGRRFRCDEESRRPGDCDIAFFQTAYQQVVTHVASDTTNEQGGLLWGYEVRDPDSGWTTVWVTQALPAVHAVGTPQSLTIPAEQWAEFDRHEAQLRQLGVPGRRVGWYHSHPDIAIFLSRWDLDVCLDFPRPTHVALVVDPVNDTGGFFVHGEEGFRPRNPQGFTEIRNLQATSVVTWTNTTEVVEANQATVGRPACGNGSAPEALESTETANSVSDPLSGTPLLPGTTLDRLSHYMVPPWAFILVAAILPLLVAWVVTTSVRTSQATLERSLDARLSEQRQALTQALDGQAVRTQTLATQVAQADQQLPRQMQEALRPWQERTAALAEQVAQLGETFGKTQQALAEDLRAVQERLLTLEHASHGDGAAKAGAQ